MSIFKKRKQAPAIEDAIRKKLKGEAQMNALDFVAFLIENGFACDWSGVDNTLMWTPVYQGEGFGNIAVAQKFNIMVAQKHAKEYVDFVLWIGCVHDFEVGDLADDALKEFAWAHVVNCRQEKYCTGYCKSSRNRWTIFGKEYESTCHAPLAFYNPDADDFDNIKKLLLLLKHNRDNTN